VFLPEGIVTCQGGIGVGGFSLFLDAKKVGIPQFASLLPRQDITGAVDFTGNVGGDYDLWDVDGTFALADLTMPGFSRIARVDGSGRVQKLPADPEGEVQLAATGIESSLVPVQVVRGGVRFANGVYTMDQVYVGIDSTEFLEFSLEARDDEEGRVFTMRDLLIFHGGSTSSSPGAVVLRERYGSWSLEESSLSFARGTVTARGEFTGGSDILVELSAAGIDLYEAGQFLRLEHDLEGVLESELTISGTREEPRMSVSLRALDVYLEGALVDSVNASASYANHILLVEGFSIWKGPLETNGSFNIPIDLALASRKSRLDAGRKLLGEMNIDLPLNLVNLVNEDFRASGGFCRAVISVSGTAGEPRWTGSGEIVDGSGLYIPTNSYFESMSAAFRMSSDSLVVESLRAASGEGEIKGSGVILLEGMRLEAMNFGLRLDDYQVHQVKYVTDLTLDGDLVLEGTPKDPLLHGILELRNGEISIPFGGARREGTNGRVMTFPLRLDITLSSGESLWFRNKQANVEMDFSLSLRDGPQGVRVSGEIWMERGYYLFNGRKFDVEEGTVRFAGSTVINPLLDVNASRIVRGRIQTDPESPPEMVENEMRLHIGGYYDEVDFQIEILDDTGTVLPVSREEAFTLLLLDMTKQEYDLQQTFYRERVGNQVMNFMGHQAASLLQDASPLDVITVDTELFSPGTGQESASVSVGKYFARRVFLSYSQDIINPSINNITVEYGLRKRMFIVGEIGQADAAQQAQYYSIDFKYRFKY
jgi:autotransporter translocation and assembly factor TamB